MNENIKKYLDEKGQIEKALSDSSHLKDSRELSRLGKRLQQLELILATANSMAKLEEEILFAERMQASKDADEQELGSIELPKLQTQLHKARENFDRLTIARDPLDEREAIIEIRAGAGGDEAALFAAELFRMYVRFCEKQNFSSQTVSTNRIGIGGYKEVILEVHGDGAFGLLRWESGVHRVQRVPATEKNGRVHTSTVTVAVLPVVEERDVKIKPEDVKIEVTTSSGHGGQSVNTTYSAIRLLHVPTGITVSCQDERSQKQNREKAFEVLRARIFAFEEQKRREKDSSIRKQQIGTGDRSEKIRTYNFPQDRMTDHRIKQNFHSLPTIMDGGLLPIISAVKQGMTQADSHA